MLTFDALPSQISKLDLNQYRQMMIPEWLKLYLDYETLCELMMISGTLRQSKKIYKLTNKQVYEELNQNEQLRIKCNMDYQQFLTVLYQEIQKIESFIIYKYQDLSQKLNLLGQQIKYMNAYGQYSDKKKKTQILQQQFYELFKQQLQFQSFLKTHIIIIKQLSSEIQYCFRQELLEKDEFILEKFTLQIQQDMNKTYILLSQNFYLNNPNVCKKNLDKYKNKRQTSSITIYQLGLFFGVSIFIVTIIILMRIEGYLDPENEKLFSPIFPCYRGTALLLIYYWFLALDQYLWTQYSINYQLYLGFNHHFSTVPEVIKRVCFFSALYLILFLINCIELEEFGFFKMHLMIQLFPLLLWIILILYLLIPTQKQFNGQGRKWMYRMFIGALFTHFITYDGRYTFVLDQFVSLISPIRDLYYTICYYNIYFTKYKNEESSFKECDSSQRYVGDICIIIIFSIKSLHCLTSAKKNNKFYKTPDMWNFLKNLLAISVGVIGYLNKFDIISAILWIIFASSFTIIQYYWEIKKDWLLLQDDSKILYLRNDLAFFKPYIYYCFMILQMIVISAWTFTISPYMYVYLKIPNQQLYTLLVGILEITRRFIHNLLKVEKEHVVNLRQFKASKDILYPFPIYEENICDKFRLSNYMQHSQIEFQRLSLEIRRNTEVPYHNSEILQLLEQPYSFQVVSSQMVDRRQFKNKLNTKNFIKIIQQIIDNKIKN